MNPSTARLHSELVAIGAWSLTASQLQAASDAGLGPLPSATAPAEHWQALCALGAVGRGKTPRLPDADEVAVLLAEQGYPCRRLASSLRLLLDEQAAELDLVPLGEPGPATNPLAETGPEAAARSLVERTGHREGDPTLLDTFTRRMVAGTMASGDPYPEDFSGSANDVPLRHAGRVLAVLDQLGEAAGDPSRINAIDASDLSANLSGALPLESVELGLATAASLGDWQPFGPTATAAIASVESGVLAGAVQAAASLAPLLTAMGVTAPRSRRTRLRLVAMAVPMVLGFGELVAAQYGAGAPGQLHREIVELVEGSPDRLAHYREAAGIAALPEP